MKKVHDILESKGKLVFTIEKSAMVGAAVALMAEHNVGALLVTEGQRLWGIVSERDLLRNVVLSGSSPTETAVSQVATKNPICVSPDDNVDDCMAVMTARRVRHLPVLVDGRLVGVVSIGDVVKDLLDERGFEIQALNDYIAGKYPG